MYLLTSITTLTPFTHIYQPIILCTFWLRFCAKRHPQIAHRFTMSKTGKYEKSISFGARSRLWFNARRLCYSMSTPILYLAVPLTRKLNKTWCILGKANTQSTQTYLTNIYIYIAARNECRFVLVCSGVFVSYTIGFSLTFSTFCADKHLVNVRFTSLHKWTKRCHCGNEGAVSRPQRKGRRRRRRSRLLCNGYALGEELEMFFSLQHNHL